MNGVTTAGATAPNRTAITRIERAVAGLLSVSRALTRAIDAGSDLAQAHALTDLARFRVEAAGRDLDALLAELGGEPAGWFDDDTTTETAEDVQ